MEDADAATILSCWIAVTDATVENGCLQVIPGEPPARPRSTAARPGTTSGFRSGSSHSPTATPAADAGRLGAALWAAVRSRLARQHDPRSGADQHGSPLPTARPAERPAGRSILARPERGAARRGAGRSCRVAPALGGGAAGGCPSKELPAFNRWDVRLAGLRLRFVWTVTTISACACPSIACIISAICPNAKRASRAQATLVRRRRHAGSARQEFEADEDCRDDPAT